MHLLGATIGCRFGRGNDPVVHREMDLVPEFRMIRPGISRPKTAEAPGSGRCMAYLKILLILAAIVLASKGLMM